MNDHHFHKWDADDMQRFFQNNRSVPHIIVYRNRKQPFLARLRRALRILIGKDK